MIPRVRQSTNLILDEKLGGTKNADLLCSYGSRSRLVEVKSASGSAPERAYQDLIRHLREWPTLPGNTPVEGGALVLNHEHRIVPLERRPKPYDRPEFLAAQTEPIITTLELFSAWCEADPATIRSLLFGPLAEQGAPAEGVVTSSVLTAGPRKPEAGRRGWLGRWRR